MIDDRSIFMYLYGMALTVTEQNSAIFYFFPLSLRTLSGKGATTDKTGASGRSPIPSLGWPTSPLVSHNDK